MGACPQVKVRGRTLVKEGSNLPRGTREVASVGKNFKKGKSIPSEKCQSRQKNQLFILFVQLLICRQIGGTRCIWPFQLPLFCHNHVRPARQIVN
jgi:hypothetical protein